jgi:hypothetical protein
MSTEIDRISNTSEVARRIQDLDPLGADHFMVDILPTLNSLGKVGEVISLSKGIIPSGDKIEAMDGFEARAAIRDLGMVASSIQKHGVPTRKIPDLERSLILIGMKLDEIPRETVFHYGPWNPADERTRTFTGTEEEKIFIQSFREGMQGLDLSINSLLELQNKSVFDLGFSHTLDLARDGFQKMVSAMVEVRRKVTPDFFSFQMRPYFPALTINGQVYQAPGGAQMPVLLIDRMVWGIDCKDNVYQEYYGENLKYLPKNYREIDQLIETNSLVTRFLKEADAANLAQTQEGISLLLLVLLKFRLPHLKTAKANFEKRPEGSKGSGGYTPTILEHLIILTNDAKRSIDSKEI